MNKSLPAPEQGWNIASCTNIDSLVEQELHKKAFMGVSTGHKFFSKKNMTHYIGWLSRNFDDAKVILMDDPHKYNFMVFKGETEEHAHTKARDISSKIKIGYERVKQNLDVDNVNIVRFKDFVEDDAYVHALDTIRKHYDEDNTFKQDLVDLMDRGIGGKILAHIEKNNLSREEAHKARNVLANYIVEELASLVYFTEQGYRIEVDQTKEFSTKKNLYEGQYPALAKELNIGERGHIYTHPIGVEKNTY